MLSLYFFKGKGISFILSTLQSTRCTWYFHLFNNWNEYHFMSTITSSYKRQWSVSNGILQHCHSTIWICFSHNPSYSKFLAPCSQNLLSNDKWCRHHEAVKAQFKSLKNITKKTQENHDYLILEANFVHEEVL